MATISELNVRLGLLYKDFDKSLTAVEKRLERSGRKFSQLGNDLALSISLPLAALGASAVKQAGEIEALKLAMTSTFKDAGRSAGDAAKEIDALREAAKAPGLDFEQAIKGSIRLQGVGLSAEEARKTLTEMANAIALTGGTAQELDGVTRQFAQMISKGRVLQEDVSILAENMPKISDLMQKAFGTRNVEAIRNMGVSGAEFVKRITEAANGLTRVEGGIKNALVNAGAEARQSLAALGEVIVKAFDVTGKIDAVSAALNGVVKWFKNLDDSTQSTIVTVGAFFVALGPAVKLIGAIQGTGAAAISAIGALGGGLKSLASKAIETAAAFNALSAAQRAAIGVGIAVAIYAAIAAYQEYNRELTAAESAQKAVADVQKEALSNIAKEKSEVDFLIGILNNETASREQKGAALKKLQQISPAYFGQLKEENGLVNGLTKAYDEYIKALIQSARAAAAREKLVEIERQLLDLEGNRLDKQKEAIGVAAAFGKSKSDVLKREQELFTAETARLNAQKAALAGIVAQNEQQIAALDTTTGKTLEQAAAERLVAEEADKAAKKRAEAYKNVLNSIDAVNKKQAELGADFIGEKTKEIEAGVEKLIEAGFAQDSPAVQKLKGYLKQIREEIAASFGSANKVQAKIGADVGGDFKLPTLPAAGVSLDATSFTKQLSTLAPNVPNLNLQPWLIGLAAVQEQAKLTKEVTTESLMAIGAEAQRQTEVWQAYTANFNAAMESAMQRGQGLEAVMYGLGSAFVTAFAESAAGTKSFAAVFVREASKVIGAQIKMAVIQAALGALQTAGGNPIVGIVLAAAAGAAAEAVFTGLVNSLVVPALASGGVATSPMMAMIGEYPGARQNPEIVTPERLMRSVFRDEMQGGGFGGGVLTTRVAGSDLLVVLERTQKKNERVRGF